MVKKKKDWTQNPVRGGGGVEKETRGRTGAERGKKIHEDDRNNGLDPNGAVMYFTDPGNMCPLYRLRTLA